MKKEISPGAIAAVVVILVLIIGFFAFRTFFPDTTHSPNSAEDIKHYNEVHQNSAINQRMVGQPRGRYTRTGANGQ